MKKILFSALFLVLTICSFSQDMKLHVPKSRQEYLKISKVQKSTAWNLLIGGTTVIGSGLLIGTSDPGGVQEDWGGAIFGASLILVGGVVDLISIPFFLESSKNKRRGIEAVTSLKLQEVSPLVRANIKQANIPELSLKLRF